MTGNFKADATQQKLFEVKTRIAMMIERIELSDTKDNIVRVTIPKIADLCRDIVPEYFRGTKESK